MKPSYLKNITNLKFGLVDKNRKGWIDALRGLAIILVVYGHCIKTLDNVIILPEFFIYTSPIKMPLFFAIAGYLFHNNREWSVFLKSLFRKLIIPWLILGLFPHIAMVPLFGVSQCYDFLIKMLTGKALWFMPCFIIGEVFFYSINRYCKTTRWILICAFFCFAIGLYLHKHNILNYAMFNRALVVQVFFSIGYLFRQYENKIICINWGWLVFGGILYLSLCYVGVILYPGSSIDVHMNRYYNIPYCLLLIFEGCLLLFTIARKANVQLKFMSFIGQNTLLVYIWNGLSIGLLIKVASIMGWIMPINWWTAIIKVVWACTICGICSLLLNHYLPFAIGKSSSKNNSKKQN